MPATSGTGHHCDFDVPNLDDCTDDDRADLRNVFGWLERYCAEKNAATRARVQGRIPDAITHETNCQRLYDSLPLWARW